MHAGNDQEGTGTNTVGLVYVCVNVPDKGCKVLILNSTGITSYAGHQTACCLLRGNNFSVYLSSSSVLIFFHIHHPIAKFFFSYFSLFSSV